MGVFSILPIDTIFLSDKITSLKRNTTLKGFIMKKFVLYRRLSKKTSTNQHGFESQKLDIDLFLNNKTEPFEVVGDFKEYISGGEDVKPELEKAMQLCRETGAELLIAKVDRFSRRVSQIALLLESDITLRVASLGEKHNNMEIHIYAMLAEAERSFIKLRVKKGLEAAKAKGIKLGASNPKHKETYQKNKSLGLHKKDKEYKLARKGREVIVLKISEVIKMSDNSLSFEKIADKLNLLGVKTPKGKDFSKATVSRVMKEFNMNRINGEYQVE